MSKTVKEHCFARISVISQPFWLFLGSFRWVNPCRLQVWIDTGAGAGQAELPVGYPRQSLVTSADRHDVKNQPKRKVQHASLDLIWAAGRQDDRRHSHNVRNMPKRVQHALDLVCRRCWALVKGNEYIIA